MRPAQNIPPAPGVQPVEATASGLTDLELTWIEQRLEHWLRFGRVAAERIVSRRTRIVSFRPEAVFGFVRWGANDFGTIFSSISVIAAPAPRAPFATHPYVRPGGDILLRVDGWPRVEQVLSAIDAIEAAGLDPCETAPDHWRHIGSHIAAGLPFRPYGPERHRAWLQRKAIAP